jgi:valyl-tRNA synthetase
MKGLIDVDAERQRLAKQRQKIEADLSRAEAKLANPKFVDNAPDDVVAQERERQRDFRHRLAQLDEQLEKLEAIA